MREEINVNAVLPGFAVTRLAPPNIIAAMKKAGHLTPMSSILKAYETIIREPSRNELIGETIKVSGDQLY